MGPMAPAPSPVFEVLDHTADVGLRARGRSLEEAFAHAALGLAEILGRRAEGGGSERVELRVASSDLEALLVEWLNEVLFRLEHGERCLARAEVRRVRVEGPAEVEATLLVEACPGAPEGTEVKGATYHQLSVRAVDGGYEATVYLDV
jgi:SHS2 domain-containing protein